jgi:diguanylate cyclase (GGDEF)-like protein
MEGAVLAAEKLRDAVASFNFRFNDVDIPITISLGVAQIDPNLETGDEAIARADLALYHSKHQGRNRATVHPGIGKALV